MQWNNAIQKAIIKEWTDGVQKCKGVQARRILRKRIAQKYNLGVNMIQGVIELGALEGLSHRPGGGESQGPRRYEPINYHELIGDLKERVANLERKFNYLLEGIDRVVEDGETMRIHIQHLRGIAQWARRRDVIDMEDPPKLAISRK